MDFPVFVSLHWAVCSAGVGASLVLAVLVFRGRRPDPPAPAFWPDIALLKPFDGIDPGLEAAFRTTLTADYPGPRHIYFCTDVANAEGIAVAQRVIAEADGRAELVLTKEGPDAPASRKIRHLQAGLNASAQPVVVNADSTTHLRDGALRAVVATLVADPRRGGAWASYTTEGARTIGARLAHVAFTATAFSFVVVDAMRSRIDGPAFFVGGLFALRRDALNDVGGFGPFGDHLTEDLPLGAALHERGWHVVRSPVDVTRRLGPETVGDFHRRMFRWTLAMIAVRSPMLVHYAPAQLALALACVTLPLAVLEIPDHAPLLGIGTAALLGARWTLAAVLAGVGRPARSVRDVLWLLPLVEASMAVGFVTALLRPRVSWRGRTFVVGEGGRVVVDRS